MSAPSLVRRGRRQAEALMVDLCEIRGPDIDGEVDPETLTRPRTPGPLRYAGKCKVQTYEPFESPMMGGEYKWTVQRYALHIPTSATRVEVNDIAVITFAAIGEDLVGRSYRIAGLHSKSLTTARRLLIDEIISPEEES